MGDRPPPPELQNCPSDSAQAAVPDTPSSAHQARRSRGSSSLFGGEALKGQTTELKHPRSKCTGKAEVTTDLQEASWRSCGCFPCDRGQEVRSGFVGVGDGLVFPGNCFRSNGVPPNSCGEILVPVTQTVGSRSEKVVADAVREDEELLEGDGQLFPYDWGPY